MEYYHSIKKNEIEDLYELIGDDFQQILSIKGSLQKNICSMLPFVQKRRKVTIHVSIYHYKRNKGKIKQKMLKLDTYEIRWGKRDIGEGD